MKTNKKSIIKTKIYSYFFDQDGNKIFRGDLNDFGSIRIRHHLPILKICDTKKDNLLKEWIKYARYYYDICDYEVALDYLKKLLSAAKELFPFLFYYIRNCERVISIPLTIKEISHLKNLAKYNNRSKWLRWIYAKPKLLVRCKWCGRYTAYIYYNVPTFGLPGSENSCDLCGRMYPMPSWLWDSPDGRAYSYYRGSFSGDEFYNEFEKDYDPIPKRDF